jgi:hypothetical protein
MEAPPLSYRLSAYRFIADQREITTPQQFLDCCLRTWLFGIGACHWLGMGASAIFP